MIQDEPIVLVAGGTGGHLFPAQAVAQALLKTCVLPTLLVTDDRGARFAIQEGFSHVEVLKPAPFNGRLGKIPFLIKSFFQALRFLHQTKPRSVWGFGGLMSLSVLLAAWVLRIPIGLHQADRILGKANYLLSYLASTLAITFPRWDQAPRQPNKRIRQVQTGLPIRPSIEAGMNAPYFQRKHQDPFQVLILGGSQGAQFWGEVLPKAIALLSLKMQRQLRLRHQCPELQVESLTQAYASTGAHADVIPFIQNIGDALINAHLVCARAGASTLAELSSIGRPALLVPYPHAMDDHQTANAAYIAEQGGAYLIQQPALTPEKLSAFLEEGMSHPQALELAASRMLHTLPEGSAAALAALMVEG